GGLDGPGARSSPAEIWPPNHRFVPVSTTHATDPGGTPLSVTVTGITQDEPLNDRGDGNTCPDARGIGSSTAFVRAERSGLRNGRVYHVAFTAGDGRGGTCTGVVRICVPHDRRSGHVCT